MEAILESFKNFIVVAINLLGQKEILGVIFGAILGVAISVISYWIKSRLEQKDRNMRALQLITGNIQVNIQVAKNNIATVSNEIKNLPQTFTLNPLQEFLPSAADMLLITGSFVRNNSFLLWSSLKTAEVFSSQVHYLYSEALAIKRAIKSESKSEIYMLELLPHLSDLDKLLLDTLEKIYAEYNKAYDFTKSLNS